MARIPADYSLRFSGGLVNIQDESQNVCPVRLYMSTGLKRYDDLSNELPQICCRLLFRSKPSLYENPAHADYPKRRWHKFPSNGDPTNRDRQSFADYQLEQEALCCCVSG